MATKNSDDYVDRTAKLSSSSRKPNVVPSAQVEQFEDQSYKSPDRLFKYRMLVPSDGTMLVAKIMYNEICVLFFSKSQQVFISQKKASFTFSTSLHTDGISGKRKKAALTINSGYGIGELKSEDGEIIKIKTPVGGQLLEMNETLISQLHVKNDDNDIERVYIAVLLPNTWIPTLDNVGNTNWFSDYITAQRERNNKCFAFMKGACLRGAACKFLHETTVQPSSSTGEPYQAVCGAGATVEEVSSTEVGSDETAISKKRKAQDAL